MASLLAKLKALVVRQTSLTVIGHSHLWAMTEAFEDAPLKVRLIDFWKAANPYAQDELARLDEILGGPLKGPVVSVIDGSRHDILSLYRHPRPFDFVLPDEPNAPLDPGAELIPLAAVRAALLVWIQHTFDLLAAVQLRTTGAMFHLDSPPPWGNERNIADYEDLWDNPTGALGSRGMRRRVAKLHSQMLAEFCALHGIILIPYPPQTADAEGYLAAPYHLDLVHANKAYGKAAVDQVIAAVRNKR